MSKTESTFSQDFWAESLHFSCFSPLLLSTLSSKIIRQLKKKGVYAMLQTINRGREQHLNYRALPWRHIIKQTVVIVPITDCTLLQLINKWMDVYFVSTRSPSQIVSEKQSYYCKLLAKRSSLCCDSDTRHRQKAATDWWTQAGDQFLY